MRIIYEKLKFLNERPIDLQQLQTLTHEVCMKILTIALLIALTACGTSHPTVPGPAGPVGPSGTPGSNGAPGTPGVGCTQTQVASSGTVGSPDQYGGSLITCPGSSVLIRNGAPGGQGPSGAQGDPGASGSVITMAQFCPGYQVVYPSSFPEVGFCLDDKIYAVYYDHTYAFLTEIPPGTYSSTSPDACTFTVTAHCGITR